MAEYTPNLALKKPSNSDYVRISDNNENMDVLDAEIKALQDAIEELESVEVINDLNHTDTDKALSANQGKVLDDKISTLTGRIANGEKTAAYEAKRLDNLIKLTQGKVFDYQTDATEAYSKTIPSGSQEYGALDVVGGKSLIWNQHSNIEDFSQSYTDAYCMNKISNYIFIENHTYLYVQDATSTEEGFNVAIGVGTNSAYKKDIKQILSTQETTSGRIMTILTPTATNLEEYKVFTVRPIRYTTPKTFTATVKNIQLFDLTQMFGVGNEPTLEQCKEIFSADYYPYNTGELMNFGVNEVETAGRNLLETTTAHFTKPTGYNGTWNSSLKNGALVIPTSSNYGAGGFGGVWIDCEPNTTYLLSGYAESDTNTTAYTCTRALSENGTFHNQTYATILSGNSGYFSISITTTENCDRLAFRLTGRYSSSSVRGEDFVFSNLMIEKVATAGATPTAYCPYRKETFTIPQNVLNLTDYGASAGSVYNYIDFDRKVYVQNVKSVDLGTLNWTTRTTGSVNIGYSVSLPYNYVSLNSASTRLHWTTNSAYNGGTNASIISSSVDEMDIGVYHYNTSSSTGTIYFITPVGSTPSGKLNYKLATPIETDISDLIDNGLIFAEGNGTITFKNIHGDDYHISVPNKETYMVKLADAI